MTDKTRKVNDMWRRLRKLREDGDKLEEYLLSLGVRLDDGAGPPPPPGHRRKLKCEKVETHKGKSPGKE